MGSPGTFRILYIAELGPRASGSHRCLALQRLGHELREFNTLPYYNASGWPISAIRMRTLWGSVVDQINRDFLRAAREYQPEIIWLEKSNFLRRETVVELRRQGFYVVHQNDDNPFGPRRDPGWRLIMEALPEYDLHLLPRRVSLDEYRKAGARDVFWLVPAYEPSLHYLPPAGWSEADKDIDVALIGFPHDKRPEYALQLWKRHGIKVKVWGDERWGRKWPRAKLPPDARAALYQGHSLSYQQYRETIWRSRIMLGFVSNLNRDEFSGRSFEIPASGGFLLAEETKGHREMYKDGDEAVFFTSIDDCAAKILHYLPDAEARARISMAGHLRTINSPYSMDARANQALTYIRQRLNERR